MKKKQNQVMKLLSEIPPAFLTLAIAIVIIGFVLYIETQTPVKPEKLVVRASSIAGTWYPGTREALLSFLNSTLDTKQKKLYNLKAIIVPHAGYRFSGAVAARGFSFVPSTYKKVIVLGLSHHYLFNGLSVFNGTHYETPLGLVKLSDEIAELLNEPGVSYQKEAHIKEHSIEIELPFLQYILGDFELVPMLTSKTDPKQLADLLSKYTDGTTLIVVSTDLSHYHPYGEAIRIDNKTIRAILNLNITDFITHGEACNKLGVLGLLYLAKQKAWKPLLLQYENSGDTAGDKSRVVGYTAIAFVEEELTEQEQQFLLKLSRTVLSSIFNKSIEISVNESELSPKLKEKRGCFVTLHKFGRLRGCIGHIIPQEPLWKCVIDNSRNAALNDRRFQPVTADELKDIDIEISVLSQPEELEYRDKDELLDKLQHGYDGVVLEYGFSGATYLPQVWEQLPDKKDFLAHLCRKAGAPLDCWERHPKILTYHAFVFSE